MTVTEYSDAKIVAIFSSNSPVITASTQTITSSDDEITIYGCNFNILNPDTNKIAFSSSYVDSSAKCENVKHVSHFLNINQPTLLSNKNHSNTNTKLARTQVQHRRRTYRNSQRSVSRHGKCHSTQLVYK